LKSNSTSTLSSTKEKKAKTPKAKKEKETETETKSKPEDGGNQSLKDKLDILKKENKAYNKKLENLR